MNKSWVGAGLATLGIILTIALIATGYTVEPTPTGDPEEWQLTVNTARYNLSDLHKMPQERLEAARVSPGSREIRATNYTGAPLRLFIEGPARVESNTSRVNLSGWATRGAVIALYKDDEPLPVPRLIVPGYYEEYWLEGPVSIDQGEGNTSGEFGPTSKILRPEWEETLTEEYLVRGVAVAPRGVDRVEVSTDDGQTWHNASINRTGGVVGWAYLWHPPSVSNYHVLSRAIENGGRVENNPDYVFVCRT